MLLPQSRSAGYWASWRDLIVQWSPCASICSLPVKFKEISNLKEDESCLPDERLINKLECQLVTLQWELQQACKSS